MTFIAQQRGKYDDYIFPYRGKRITRLHNTAWENSLKKSGLPISKEFNRGPHNLKHTFGRRLRNAGVSLETRKVLLKYLTPYTIFIMSHTKPYR